METNKAARGSPIAVVIPETLYLGSAKPPAELRHLGMRFILNLARKTYGKGRARHFRIRDGREDPRRLLRAARKIERRIREGKTPLYVHCHAGKSRSPTVVALYLVISGTAPDLTIALEQIRRTRPIAHPNQRIWASAEKAVALWREQQQ